MVIPPEVFLGQANNKCVAVAERCQLRLRFGGITDMMSVKHGIGIAVCVDVAVAGKVNAVRTVDCHEEHCASVHNVVAYLNIGGVNFTPRADADCCSHAETVVSPAAAGVYDDVIGNMNGIKAIRVIAVVELYSGSATFHKISGCREIL